MELIKTFHKIVQVRGATLLKIVGKIPRVGGKGSAGNHKSTNEKVDYFEKREGDKLQIFTIFK